MHWRERSAAARHAHRQPCTCHATTGRACGAKTQATCGPQPGGARGSTWEACACAHGTCAPKACMRACVHLPPKQATASTATHGRPRCCTRPLRDRRQVRLQLLPTCRGSHQGQIRGICPWLHLSFQGAGQEHAGQGRAAALYSSLHAFSEAVASDLDEVPGQAKPRRPGTLWRGWGNGCNESRATSAQPPMSL